MEDLIKKYNQDMNKNIEKKEKIRNNHNRSFLFTFLYKVCNTKNE